LPSAAARIRPARRCSGPRAGERIGLALVPVRK
jgi:hypothetical protein